MDRQELVRLLEPLRPSERQFAEYFRAFPQAYATPNDGWADFRSRCLAQNGGAELPERTEVFLGPVLTEADCFHTPRGEVRVIQHDRFFPPYRQRVSFVKVLYCLNGTADFYSGGRKLTLSAGGFVIVPPDAEHAVFAGSEDSLLLNLIVKKSTFGSAFASLLAGQDMISDFFWQMLYCRSGADVLYFPCGGADRLSELVVRLYEEELEGECANEILCKGLVISFFGTAIKYHAEAVERIAPQNSRRTAVPAIIRYVWNHFQTVTLEELAEHFHRSEGYLSRYIHAETGVTFRVLQREFRLERAAEMLCSSDCTVEEIITAVGYTEASRFYRNFRERYGMTPAVYRSRSRLPLYH